MENTVIEKVLCDKMNLFPLFEIYMKDTLEARVFQRQPQPRFGHTWLKAAAGMKCNIAIAPVRWRCQASVMSGARSYMYILTMIVGCLLFSTFGFKKPPFIKKNIISVSLHQKSLFLLTVLKSFLYFFRCRAPCPN